VSLAQERGSECFGGKKIEGNIEKFSTFFGVFFVWNDKCRANLDYLVAQIHMLKMDPLIKILKECFLFKLLYIYKTN
jgi:hypothetical protein